MSDNPFFRENNRNDWIFVANAALALANDDFSELERAFGSLGAGVVSVRDPGRGFPPAYLYIGGDQVVVVIQGTEGVAQWVGQILGSFQMADPLMHGLATDYVLKFAKAIVADISPLINHLLTDHRLVFMGHSLGGATAQVLGNIYGFGAEAGLSVLTIGAPRVGNPAFAAYIGGNVQRLESVNDPICNIPPVSWAGIGSAFPIPGTGPAQTFQHAGTSYQLTQVGAITAGSQDLPTDQIVEQLVTASTPTHAASWYLSALQAQSDLAAAKPGDDGYVDPQALYNSTLAQLNLPPFQRLQKGLPMSTDLIQGTLYFRDKNVSEGWSEQIYTIGDVAGMLGTLSTVISPRSMFLANDMQIFAYRAAIVGGTKYSRTIKMAVPRSGQFNEGVNEAKDAILYLGKSDTNPRRIFTFRGVPDGSIGADGLTNAGQALLALIDAYMQQLKDAGMVFKTISTLGLGKQQIQSLANAVPGGTITVTTVTAHGLSDGDIINLQGIRGYPYLLGRWKIQVLTSTTFALTGSERYNISSGRVGTIELVDYVGTTMTSWGFDSVGTRATGRPFSQPRGKRPKKVLHQ